MPASNAQSIAKREPAVLIGSAGGAVGAILSLLVAFGLDLSEDQQAAILGVVAAVVPIISAILIRRKVSPVDAGSTVDDPGSE